MRDYIQDYYRTHPYTGPTQFVEPHIARGSLDVFKHELPEVKVYYALKSFNDSCIVDVLDPALDGYDVASVAECYGLTKRGVDPGRLIFANPVKSSAQIKESYALGVRRYVVQSCDEIDKMSVHAPGAEILIRMKIDDTANKTGQKFSLKFGADICAISDIIAHASKKSMNVVGLTFHVGSQCESSEPWLRAIASADTIIRQYGLSVLDIGGGFPVDYFSQVDTTFQAISADIRRVLAVLPAGTEVLAEPGRFLSARCASTVSSVIGRERRGGEDWLYIDMGIFQGLFEAVEFHRLLQPVALLYKAPGSGVPYVIAGPTCDGDDIVTRACSIEGPIKDEDLLLIGNTGAYTEAYQSTLNSFTSPTKVYL